jgi:spoIIIJ-associated protein
MGHEGSVFEGKTLDDAVRKGLEATGRSRAEVMITILEEGSGGFLGLGARPYKVRIMPRPGGAFREPEREREPGRVLGTRGGRERGEGGPGRGREGRGRGEARPARGDRPERGARVSAAGGRGRAPADGAPAAPRSERPAAGRRDERRREGRPMRGAPPAREPGREPDRDPRPLEAQGPGEGAPGREPAGAPSDEGFGPPSEGRRRRRGRRGRGPGSERPERGGERSGAPSSEEPLREESFREEPLRTEPVNEERFRSEPASEEPFREEPYREEPVRERAPAATRPESEGGRGGPRERFTPATATMDQGPGLSSDELAATGKRLAEELLAAMGFEATVTASALEDHVDVAANVTSNEELLTGKKGEVRQALQHILNRMLNRGEGSRYHLQLEVNEFWKNREDELRELALRLAEEALEGNTEAVTEYLNAQERRIVHVALKEDTRVKTYALGTGLIKRVAVAPADFPEGPETD